MRVIVNGLLVTVFLGILVIPIIGSHVLISYAPVVAEGDVAGVQQIDASVVNILPNLRDFNEYVAYHPTQVENGRYSDRMQVTVFQRQKATYQGVYSIYNMSEDQTLTLDVVSTKVDYDEVLFDQIVISLADGAHSFPLENELEAGTTFIPLEGVGLFKEKEYALVGREIVEVVAVTAEGIVTVPLKESHKAGETVYPQSIVITPQQMRYPKTSQVTLLPGERTQMHIEVFGTANVYLNDEMIDLPLEFRLAAD